MLSTTIHICSAKSRARELGISVQSKRLTFLGFLLASSNIDDAISREEIRFHEIVEKEFIRARCSHIFECRIEPAMDELHEKRNEKGQAPRSLHFASQEVVNNCNRNETIILHNRFVVRQQLVYGRFVAFQPCRCCVENGKFNNTQTGGGMRLIHVVDVVVAISIGRIYCVSNSK